jgi:hypothetical protein
MTNTRCIAGSVETTQTSTISFKSAERTFGVLASAWLSEEIRKQREHTSQWSNFWRILELRLQLVEVVSDGFHQAQNHYAPQGCIFPDHVAAFEYAEPGKSLYLIMYSSRS